MVYRRLWDKIDMDGLVKRILKNRKLKFDFANVLYLLLIDRLLCARSKLATFLGQDRYLNIAQVEQHHLYRLLDVLADSKEQIERFLFLKQRNLFNMQVDVVFYDLTTFHFESVRADELKDFGFSKAGKFNEVQVVLGLLVDKQGCPIGFDLYPGNTFEGNTLIDALEKLKERFQIRRLVFVADKGLNSARNLNLIRQAGYEYIVSCPLKTQRKAVIDQILNQEGYTNTFDTQTGALTFKYKWLAHQVCYKDQGKPKVEFEDRLLVSWSAPRAERDWKNRERHVEKARKMIEDKQFKQSKKGAARYIRTSGDQCLEGLDEDKVARDAQWDGYYGIQTNSALDHTTIMDNYSLLWKIEDSFRVLKSTMNTRPVFHWTPKRIKGHFVLCFIAFLLERNMEIKLRNNQIELSPEKLKAVLNSLEISLVKLNGDQYYLKGKPIVPAGRILKAFRIKSPANLTPTADLKLQ